MTLAPPLLSQLRAVVGNSGVVDDRDELVVYENDGFPVARGLPDAVVFPTSTEQVSAVLRLLHEHQVPLIPRGSGTGLTGGCVAFGEGVLICTSRMTRIEHVDVHSRCAVVQAGVRNAALTEALAGTGLRFAPDPSSQRASTIGGNVATNAGGISTLKHGVTVNHLLGAEFVLSDGSVVQSRCSGRTDSFGPDLPALLCGSEGTLALLTRLWVRLSPAPRHYSTFVAIFESTRDACQTVCDTIASGITPASMELMDGVMIQTVEAAFGFGFPADAGALLLIELDSLGRAALEEPLRRVLQIAHRHKARQIRHCSDAAERAQLWSARKKAFGAIGRISPSYCTQDACVPRSKLPAVLEHIAALGQHFGVTIPNVFHAGDGNIHPVLLFDQSKPEEVQRTLRLSEEILEHCLSIGGTITGEHGVGVEKLHLMPRMFSPATMALFARLKECFDPDRRLNDGKLIPSPRLSIELLQPVAMNLPGGAAAQG